MPNKTDQPLTMKAAGGVVTRKEAAAREVLMIHRNGVWDLPKGKLEEESIPACAVREVMEETGMKSKPVIDANLGTTLHTYVRDGRKIEKRTYWFVMSAPGQAGPFTPQADEGIEKVEWVEITSAVERVGYQNLKDLLQRYTEDHAG
ncbi:MAG: NUDIX domain-containing protein [Bacteroidetes bacterium]|nr:NUDIX domain-containing protein [Bacteroidota bacterium]